MSKLAIQSLTIMKELAEFHFSDLKSNLNLGWFLGELGNMLNLHKNELHRIKFVAVNDHPEPNKRKSFFILLNDPAYYEKLKEKGTYIGLWRWELFFGRFSAIALFPPRGNAGLITNSLHHDVPRMEVAIKGSNWSLFDALDAISTILPTSVGRICSLSLANEIIFAQFLNTHDADYFLIHFECSVTVTHAHSRSRIITVENYPTDIVKPRKRCILDRLNQ